MDIILTTHSIIRAKERCGFSERTLKRIALKAVENPNERKDMRNYLENIKMKHPNAEAYPYGDFVYIFIDNILQTVYNVPKIKYKSYKEDLNGICIRKKFKRKISNGSPNLTESYE